MYNRTDLKASKGVDAHDAWYDMSSDACCSAILYKVTVHFRVKEHLCYDHVSPCITLLFQVRQLLLPVLFCVKRDQTAKRMAFFA
jgi:hypothetical protein